MKTFSIHLNLLFIPLTLVYRTYWLCASFFILSPQHYATTKPCYDFLPSNLSFSCLFSIIQSLLSSLQFFSINIFDGIREKKKERIRKFWNICLRGESLKSKKFHKIIFLLVCGFSFWSRDF